MQVGRSSPSFSQLDHFHIEWAWRELNSQFQPAEAFALPTTQEATGDPPEQQGFAANDDS